MVSAGKLLGAKLIGLEAIFALISSSMLDKFDGFNNEL